VAKMKCRFESKSRLFSAVPAIAFVILLLIGPGVASSSLAVTPRINIRYAFNDNVYGVDDEYEDESTVTYLDYSAGINLVWREARHTLDLSADAGYQQFLDLGGAFDDMEDVEPRDFDFVTGQVGAIYRYSGRVITFELSDDFSRSRDLQKTFGMSTDAIGYWSLFSNNIATVTVKYSPTPKYRNRLSYRYDTMIFDDQEEVGLYKLSDSYEHRVLYRGEYDFTPKTTGILDAQVADRTFSDIEEIEAANFRIFQGYLGLRYKFQPNSYLEILGGYANRDIYDLPDNWDLKDTGDAIGRIALVSAAPQRYNLEIYADRGISLYGTNIFFVYTGAGISGSVNFSPKLAFLGGCTYRQAYYDLERNDREWLWEDDRIDNILAAQAALVWDIIQRDGEGTLTAQIGYNYQQRDSNIDDPGDFVDANGDGFPDFNFRSNDTTTGMYYGQITIKPTILLGNR